MTARPGRPPRSRSRPILIVASAVAVLMLVAVGFYLFAGSDSPQAGKFPAAGPRSRQPVASNPAKAAWAAQVDPPAQAFEPKHVEFIATLDGVPDDRGCYGVLLPTPPGSVLAVCTNLRGIGNFTLDGIVEVWDLATATRIGRIKGSPDLSHAVLSPDGQFLAGASASPKTDAFCVWSVRDGTLSQRISAKRSANFDAIGFCGPGQLLTIADSLQVWDLKTRRPLREMPSPAFETSPLASRALSPSGKLLVLADGRRLVMYDIANGKLVGETSLPTTAWQYPNQRIEFSRDGARFAVFSGTQKLNVAVVETASGRLVDQKVIGPLASSDSEVVGWLGGAGGWVYRGHVIDRTGRASPCPQPANRFGSPGRLRTVVGANSALSSWLVPHLGMAVEIDAWGAGNRAAIKPAPREAVAVLDGAGQSITHAAFSPDGTTVALLDANRTITLWDAGIWKRRSTVPNTGRTARGASTLCFSPDGKTLLLASADAFVFHDSATGRPLGSAKAAGDITAYSFAPDGSAVAAADGKNSEIRIFNCPSGSLRARTSCRRRPARWPGRPTAGRWHGVRRAPASTPSSGSIPQPATAWKACALGAGRFPGHRARRQGDLLQQRPPQVVRSRIGR